MTQIQINTDLSSTSKYSNFFVWKSCMLIFWEGNVYFLIHPFPGSFVLWRISGVPKGLKVWHKWILERKLIKISEIRKSESVIHYYRLLAVRKQPKTPRKSREQKKLIVWKKKLDPNSFSNKEIIRSKIILGFKVAKKTQVEALTHCLRLGRIQIGDLVSFLSKVGFFHQVSFRDISAAVRSWTEFLVSGHIYSSRSIDCARFFVIISNVISVLYYRQAYRGMTNQTGRNWVDFESVGRKT